MASAGITVSASGEQPGAGGSVRGEQPGAEGTVSASGEQPGAGGTISEAAGTSTTAPGKKSRSGSKNKLGDPTDEAEGSSLASGRSKEADDGSKADDGDIKPPEKIRNRSKKQEGGSTEQEQEGGSTEQEGNDRLRRCDQRDDQADFEPADGKEEKASCDLRAHDGLEKMTAHSHKEVDPNEIAELVASVRIIQLRATCPTASPPYTEVTAAVQGVAQCYRVIASYSATDGSDAFSVAAGDVVKDCPATSSAEDVVKDCPATSSAPGAGRSVQCLRTGRRGVIPEDIIEATAPPLDLQPWYLGEIDRQTAESLLSRSEVPAGTFIVRMSAPTDGFVITIKLVTGFRHRRVNTAGATFSSGSSTTQYDTLQDLVEAQQSCEEGNLLMTPYNKKGAPGATDRTAEPHLNDSS